MGRLSSLFGDALKIRAGKLSENSHPKATIGNGQPQSVHYTLQCRAIQWTGGNKSLIRAFLGLDLTESIRPDRDFGLTTINKGNTTVWVGDWLLYQPSGLYIYTPEEFTANFTHTK